MKTRLKEMRKMAGYATAESFANAMGMSVHTYRKYEQGTIDLYLDTACDFADALGCTVEQLLGRDSTTYAAMTVDFGLTERERELLELFRAADDRGRETIMAAARREAALSKNKLDAGGGVAV